MKTPQKSRRRQLGISLVEMGIAAVVISALLIGILVGLPKLQLDTRLSKARQEIPLVLNAITAAYATQLDTNGANNLILSAANVWPQDRVIDPGLTTARINGVFPGSTEFVFSNGGTTTTRLPNVVQGFSYWLHNIPKEACLPLVQLLATQRSVVEVSVGASTLTPAANRATAVVSTVTRSGLTVNMVNAAAACSAPGRKSVVALVSRV